MNLYKTIPKAAVFFAVTLAFAQSPDMVVRRVAGSSSNARVAEALAGEYSAIIAGTERFSELSGGAAWLSVFAEALERERLDEVRRDRENLVFGIRRGTGAGPVFAVEVHSPAAILPEAPAGARTDASKLSAPGIADNRSAAMLLAIVRSLRTAEVRTAGDLVFIATAGPEETRHTALRSLLESDVFRGRITGFVTLEAGPTGEIANGSLGVRHYRLGLPKPMDAAPAQELVQAMNEAPGIHRVGPLTSDSAGASLDFRIRIHRADEAGEIVANLDRRLKQIAADLSVDQGAIEFLDKIPPAATHVSRNIVQLATEVIKASGLEPRYGQSFSDAGAAMAAGIPALALGSGPFGGERYSRSEWIDTEKDATLRPALITATLLLALAGLR